MEHRVDAAVAAIAARQLGTFGRRQARSAGSYYSLERRRLDAGAWLEPFPNVFSLPGWPKSFERELWIALHAADTDALVAFESAGAVQELSGFPAQKLVLLVPHGHLHRNPLAVVHQTRLFPRATLMHGLPTTPIERTLCDLAAVVGPRRLGKALDDAILRGLTTLFRVRREFLALARPGRPGVDVMREVLAARTDGYVPTRSQLEAELDSILATIPCAPPLREVQIGERAELPHIVDRLYLEPRKLIVEGDGRLWHARLESMEKDKARDRRALRLGVPTARYGWHELRQERDFVREEIIEILGL